MSNTKKAAHTPGALRAAKIVIDGCVDGATALDYEVNAEIIDREIAIREMLEALEAARKFVRGRLSYAPYGPQVLLDQIEAAIKAGGR